MPDNFCFSPNFVVVTRTGSSELRYSFASKSYTLVPNEEPAFDAYFQSIIDVYQISSTTIRFQYWYPNDVGHFEDFTGQKLLKVVAETSPVPGLRVWIFYMSSKEVVEYFYETNIPCHPGFSLAEDVVLTANCEGYTRNEWYHDGDGGLNIVSTPNSSICGYVNPSENTDITVEQLVRVVHCDPVNPIMLVWKNSLGGWDQWLFSVTQTNRMDTDSLGSVGTPIWELETAEQTEKEIGKEKSDSIVLGADNLSKQEKTGIEQVLTSNIVYQIFRDGSKRRVKVNSGSFISSVTSSNLQSIEFEIVLPGSFLISN